MFIYVCLFVSVSLCICVPVCVGYGCLGDDDPGFVDSTFRLKTRGSLVDDVCAVYMCVCLCN